MDSYNFDAPVYIDFENLEEEEKSLDLEPVHNEGNAADENESVKTNVENSPESKPLNDNIHNNLLEAKSVDSEALKEDSGNRHSLRDVSPKIENVSTYSHDGSPEKKDDNEESLGGENPSEMATVSSLTETSEKGKRDENQIGATSVSRPGKTPQRNLNYPIRQSPRLAAISKSIRRANASRGMIPSSKKSPGVKYHRRSLSEGSNIVTSFSKVKKPSVQRKVALVRPQDHKLKSSVVDDQKNLNETTEYTKILQNNRQRAKNQSSAKGPLKPTQPVGFNFATDERLGKKQEERDSSESVNFVRTLRSNNDTASTENLKESHRGPTKVKPFNLHNPSKPKEEVKPFISLAELSLKFHTKTPDRFRVKRHNNEPIIENAKKTRNNSGGVTQPHTPNLSTRLRARSVDIPNREEVEAKELEEARKHQFKAKPLNKKILKEPDLKPVDKTKIATLPEPFDITDTRKEALKLSSLGDSCNELMSSAYSSSSIPHAGVSVPWEKRRTEPKPFSFESRDLDMIRKKKEKIQKLIEEEKKAAEFHAHLMPVHDTVKGLPPKKKPPPTKVKPFKLMSDVRGSARQQTLQRELEQLEEMEKNQRKFEAQSDEVVHKKPFVPQKSKKPLTDISGFSLNTDKRAEERKAFDMHLKEKEDEMRAAKEALEERKKREEEEMVKEMRKNAVHKAQPIKQYKPVDIKQGLLPPTQPMTPNFATDQRLRSRSSSRQNLNGTQSTSLFDASNVTNVDGTFTME